MTADRIVSILLKHVRELLRSGMFGNGAIPGAAGPGEPLGIYGPGGKLHSWFVPLVAGELLAGYFRFAPDLTLLGYSGFQRYEGSLEGCPAAADWTDKDRISKRAAGLAGPGIIVGEPVLSYDKTPSRIAWKVTSGSPDGTVRTFWVAGMVVWEDSAACDDGSFC